MPPEGLDLLVDALNLSAGYLEGGMGNDSLEVLVQKIAEPKEPIKSLIDSFVVAQPFPVRFAKNMTSFVADAFVIVVSLPICALLEKYAKGLRYGE